MIHINAESINKDFGVLRLDVNFNNGAFKSVFGFFVDENTIITSSTITDLAFPLDINVKTKDNSTDLIICIAKARLLASDKNLAMLKITNYTDDYCNFSNKKLYHQEIIQSQKIHLSHTKAPKINNKIIEQGMPYFDKNHHLIGISSKNKIIKTDEIMSFIDMVRSKNIE